VTTNDAESNATISNLAHEERRFEPPADLAANANVTAETYAEADADRLAFWAKQAERITWAEPFDEVLDWSKPPFAKWYVGGKLNAAYNCLDRHVEAGRGDKVAFHWVGEPGDTRTLTYSDLLAEVCKASNALIELGVETGDRVAIYMPMIPETPRRAPHGGLRRLLRRCAGRPDPRLRRPRRHHVRRRLPTWCTLGAEAGC
jgi:acetyl-CoA synthetase